MYSAFICLSKRTIKLRLLYDDASDELVLRRLLETANKTIVTIIPMSTKTPSEIKMIVPIPKPEAPVFDGRREGDSTVDVTVTRGSLSGRLAIVFVVLVVVVLVDGGSVTGPGKSRKGPSSAVQVDLRP